MPPSPPANVSVVSFSTASAFYLLYRSRASWTTALEVCRSRGLTLASWPGSNQELYNIFGAAWDLSYAREFWVGVVRRANTTTYEFVDGGSVPPIDGTPLDDYLQVVDPDCVTDARGCCVSLTDRPVSAFNGPYHTSRGPRLLARNCLTMQLYLCKGSLPPSPPPPSPPYLALGGDVELRFNADYTGLVTAPGRLAAFRAQVAALVQNEYAATGAKVTIAVTEVYEDAPAGETVVRLMVGLPPTITPAAAPAFLFRLVNAPSTIFNTAFCAAYSVSPPIKGSLLATSALAPPPPPANLQLAAGSDGSGDRRRAGLIGGLVGGLCLGGLLLAGVAYAAYARRRAALRAVAEIH